MLHKRTYMSMFFFFFLTGLFWGGTYIFAAENTSIDQDFDPANGWTVINPADGEYGTIQGKDGKQFHYHLGHRDAQNQINVSSAEYGSNYFWTTEQGKTETVLNKSSKIEEVRNKDSNGDWKLKGYYKKEQSSGLPAYLVVLESESTKARISYLQYGNLDGSVQVKVQRKNLSTTNKDLSIQETMPFGEFSIKMLGDNKGVYVSDYRHLNRLNIEYDQAESYSHWKGGNYRLPSLTDNGWEKKGWQADVIGEGNTDGNIFLYGWQEQKNSASGATLTTGYVVRNVEMREADPNVSIDQDFDPWNGWTGLDPANGEYGTIQGKDGKQFHYHLGYRNAQNRITVSSSPRRYGSNYFWTTAQGKVEPILSTYQQETDATTIDKVYGVDSTGKDGGWRLKGYYKKEQSSGLPAYLVILESESEKAQISYLQYGNLDGSVQVKVQRKNLSTTNQDLSIQETMPFGEFSLKMLGDNKGVYVSDYWHLNRLNIEYDQVGSYSHWKEQSYKLPSLTENGWEKEGWKADVIGNNENKWAGSSFHCWQEQKGCASGATLTAGYVIRNMEVRETDPNVSIEQDFDPWNGWRQAVSDDDVLQKRQEISLETGDSIAYEIEKSTIGYGEGLATIANLYFSKNEPSKYWYPTCNVQLGERGELMDPSYMDSFESARLGVFEKKLSSGLFAYLTIQENWKKKTQTSILQIMSRTGQIFYKVSMRNLAPTSQTMYLKGRIYHEDSKSLTKSLGGKRGIYVLMKNIQMNYYFDQVGAFMQWNGNTDKLIPPNDLGNENWATKDYEFGQTLLENSKVNIQMVSTFPDIASGDSVSNNFRLSMKLNEVNTVRVHYLDEEGNKLASDKVITGTKGEAYDVSGEKKSFPGYELDQENYPKNEKGVFNEDGIEVFYKYKRIKNSVLVRYQDEEGNEIHESKLLVGNEGDSYDVSTLEYKLDIPGYELANDKLPINTKGTIVSPGIFVTYVYKKLPALPEGYIEVPKNIQLYEVQDNEKEYIGGKGTIRYHSIDDVNDQEIEVFTDPEVTLTLKSIDEGEKEESVNVQVYHSDNHTLVEKDKYLGAVSKTNPNCDFYLKTLKNHFTKTNRQYEGSMTFKAKFK